jgi:hypothetical protein
MRMVSGDAQFCYSAKRPLRWFMDARENAVISLPDKKQFDRLGKQ